MNIERNAYLLTTNPKSKRTIFSKIILNKLDLM